MSMSTKGERVHGVDIEKRGGGRNKDVCTHTYTYMYIHTHSYQQPSLLYAVMHPTCVCIEHTIQIIYIFMYVICTRRATCHLSMMYLSLGGSLRVHVLLHTNHPHNKQPFFFKYILCWYILSEYIQFTLSASILCWYGLKHYLPTTSIHPYVHISI